MNRSTLRIAIIILTLITAAVHLFLGIAGLSDPTMRSLSILFLLNAVGYVVLLLGVLGRLPVLSVTVYHYLLMAFAAVTVIAYFAMNSFSDLNAVSGVTKLVEVLLIVATFLHLRASA